MQSEEAFSKSRAGFLGGIYQKIFISPPHGMRNQRTQETRRNCLRKQPFPLGASTVIPAFRGQAVGFDSGGNIRRWNATSCRRQRGSGFLRGKSSSPARHWASKSDRTSHNEREGQVLRPFWVRALQGDGSEVSQVLLLTTCQATAQFFFTSGTWSLGAAGILRLFR